MGRRPFRICLPFLILILVEVVLMSCDAEGATVSEPQRWQKRSIRDETANLESLGAEYDTEKNQNVNGRISNRGNKARSSWMKSNRNAIEKPRIKDQDLIEPNRIEFDQSAVNNKRGSWQCNGVHIPGDKINVVYSDQNTRSWSENPNSGNPPPTNLGNLQSFFYSKKNQQGSTIDQLTNAFLPVLKLIRSVPESASNIGVYRGLDDNNRPVDSRSLINDIEHIGEEVFDVVKDVGKEEVKVVDYIENYLKSLNSVRRTDGRGTDDDSSKPLSSALNIREYRGLNDKNRPVDSRSLINDIEHIGKEVFDVVKDVGKEEVNMIDYVENYLKHPNSVRRTDNGETDDLFKYLKPFLSMVFSNDLNADANSGVYYLIKNLPRILESMSDFSKNVQEANQPKKFVKPIVEPIGSYNNQFDKPMHDVLKPLQEVIDSVSTPKPSIDQPKTKTETPQSSQGLLSPLKSFVNMLIPFGRMLDQRERQGSLSDSPKFRGSSTFDPPKSLNLNTGRRETDPAEVLASLDMFLQILEPLLMAIFPVVRSMPINDPREGQLSMNVSPRRRQSFSDEPDSPDTEKNEQEVNNQGQNLWLAPFQAVVDTLGTLKLPGSRRGKLQPSVNGQTNKPFPELNGAKNPFGSNTNQQGVLPSPPQDMINTIQTMMNYMNAFMQGGDR